MVQLLSQVVPFVVGLDELEPVERGAWPFRGLPATVSIGGRVYRRARWWTPKAGVVAQYREAVRRKSRHLYVEQGGTWRVDHIDEWNPDQGAVWRHLVADVGVR